MLCFADATGESLAGLLRPGNAGANSAVDRISVLDAALAQLPSDTVAGREVVVRTDSAGCTKAFVEGCRERHLRFMVLARTNAQVESAIFDAVGMDELWEPARTQGVTCAKGRTSSS
jgi:Transposase DDE domain group 1